MVAAPLGYESEFRKLISDSSVIIVTGGALRSQSVANALRALPENIKYVLVHDAARAFAPKELTERVLSELRAGEKAVVPALSVVDTIKVVDSLGYVVATPDRATLRAIQTPLGNLTLCPLLSFVSSVYSLGKNKKIYIRHFYKWLS